MSTPHPSLSLLPKLPKCSWPRMEVWTINMSRATLLSRMCPMWCLSVVLSRDQRRKEGRKATKDTQGKVSFFFFFLRKSLFHLPPLLILIWFLFKYRRYSFWVVLIVIACLHACFFFCFDLCFYFVYHGPWIRSIERQLFRARFHSHSGARTQIHMHTFMYTLSSYNSKKKNQTRDRRKREMNAQWNEANQPRSR